MKRVFLYAAMLALMPASLLASSNSQTINIPQPLVCGSTPLAPGDYKVTWDGSGPIVHVTLKSAKTSVTTDAKLISKENQDPGSLVYGSRGSTNVLEQINFRHMSLVLENSQVASR
jgi:hypothetical protein